MTSQRWNNFQLFYLGKSSHPSDIIPCNITNYLIRRQSEGCIIILNIINLILVFFLFTTTFTFSFKLLFLYIDAYSELSKTSKKELSAIITDRLKPLTIFGKSFKLDVCLVYEYASEICSSRVLFRKTDNWDYKRYVRIHSVVCRVRRYLFTRLYQI